MMKFVGILIWLLGAAGPSVAGLRTPQALTRFTYTEYHMGIDARLVVYAPDKSTAEKACAAAFERIAALDTTMSDYRQNSELNKLCEKAGGPAVSVSPELYLVLERAQQMSRLSNGAFDATVGPLVRLWRAARKAKQLPSPSAIRNALKLVGWRKLHLWNGWVRLDTPGMQLDLGAIAKGYAADEAQRVLRGNGISSALVQMGGDIVVSGPPPNSKGWVVRIPDIRSRKPFDLILANKAISTSGDTEQFVEIGGKHYSHVVNPHTGQALTSRVEATVIGPDGLTTDPLSTALTLMGKRGRTRILRAYPGTRAYVRRVR